MKHIKIFESMWDGPSPPDYDDPPEAQYIGRDVDYTPEQQLFTPVFCNEEHPEETKGRGKGLPDFDLVMDKTPEQAIWAVMVAHEEMDDEYKGIWDTHQEDGVRVYDTDSLLNFATDEFKAGRYSEGVEAWEENINDYSVKYYSFLIKLITPEDVEWALNDFYNYLSPGHATYHAKERKRLPTIRGLSQGEISEAKKAITALIRYKKRLESHTVGGPTKA